VTKNKSAGTIALALSVTLADCKALLQLADEALKLRAAATSRWSPALILSNSACSGQKR
jgi:hypothetical protein